MSIWVAGAVVTTGVATAYMGGKAADKASDSQAATNKTTKELGEGQLDLAYEQWDEQLARYDEWRQIYGPLEENLGDFYNSLTPETYEAAGLQYQAEALQVAKSRAVESLAQRGLDSSGITASLNKQLELKGAEGRAEIRRDAPFKVAEEKGKFLSQGKGGPAYAPAGPDSTLANVNNNTINSMQNQADRETATANSLYSTAGSLLNTGLQYGAQNYTPKPATTPTTK